MPRCYYFSDNLVFHLQRDVTRGVSLFTARALAFFNAIKCGAKCPSCQLIFGHVVLPQEDYYLSKTGFIFNGEFTIPDSPSVERIFNAFSIS